MTDCDDHGSTAGSDHPSQYRERALEELATLTAVYEGQPSIIRRAGRLSELFERIWNIVEEVSPR